MDADESIQISTSTQEKEKEEKVKTSPSGKRTAKRLLPKVPEGDANGETPKPSRYTNLVLQDLQEKPKVKKFGSSK